MKRLKKLSCLIILVLLTSGILAQSIQTISEIQPPAEYENIHVHKLYSDSLVTSYVIWVKNAVKAHKHLKHTEHVYVLEGEGKMQVGPETTHIKPGDMVFMPKNTTHSLKVTSEKPMKVISVQTPEFLGKDRVFVE